jgi:hypothetical protein
MKIFQDLDLYKKLKNAYEKSLDEEMILLYNAFEEFTNVLALLNIKNPQNKEIQDGIIEITKMKSDDHQRLLKTRDLLNTLLKDVESIVRLVSNQDGFYVTSNVSKGQLLSMERNIYDGVQSVVDFKGLDTIFIPIELNNIEHGSIFDSFRKTDEINCTWVQNEMRATRDIKANEILKKDLTDDEIISTINITREEKQPLKNYVTMLSDELKEASSPENAIDLQLRIQQLKLLDQSGYVV